MSEFEVKSTGNFACAVGEGFVLAKFWGATTERELDVWFGAMQAALVASDHPIVSLLQVEGSAPIPSKEGRNIAAKGFAMLKKRNAGIAGVVLGEGLAIKSKRTMMRVIVSLSGVRGPFEIFEESAAALSWIGARLNEAQEAPRRPGTLRRAYAELRPPK